MCVSYDSSNKQRVHPSSTVWSSACGLFHLTTDEPHRLGMGLQQKALFKPFLTPARSTCLWQPAVYVTDFLANPLPPTPRVTHTKWNFIIKHLFACSWDSLKRFRRRALRGNEPNEDVYLSLARRVYQYTIQVYN